MDRAASVVLPAVSILLAAGGEMNVQPRIEPVSQRQFELNCLGAIVHEKRMGTNLCLQPWITLHAGEELGRRRKLALAHTGIAHLHNAIGQGGP